MNLKEEKISGEIVYEGSFLKLHKDKVLCPNGNISYREYIHHPGAAAILVKVQDKFMLEKQYRYPVSEVTLEIPAGKLDLNESPLDAAKRELEEETGYKASNLMYLGKIHTTVGFTDEVIYIYYTDELTKTKTNFDSDELILLSYHSFDEIKEMIRNGEITDSKTIAAISLYMLKKEF